MYWRVLHNSQPNTFQDCIIKRIVKGKKYMCIASYRNYSSKPCWKPNYGPEFLADKNDCWCPVDDIIENVENRLKDEFFGRDDYYDW